MSDLMTATLYLRFAEPVQCSKCSAVIQTSEALLDFDVEVGTPEAGYDVGVRYTPLLICRDCAPHFGYTPRPIALLSHPAE
jgi:hypothetical protein